MSNIGLGYRPNVQKQQKEIRNQNLSNIDKISDLIFKLPTNQKPQQIDGEEIYSFEQAVNLTKQERISAPELDTMFRTLYVFGEDIENRAQLAMDEIARVTDPIPLDDIFIRDTEEDSILLFGEPINEITPKHMECINNILFDRKSDTDEVEKTTENDTKKRRKFPTKTGVDDIVADVKSKEIKFGFEFFIALIMITAEEINSLILTPLCPFKILGIEIGKKIVGLVSIFAYTVTLGLVDLRTLCDECENKNPDTGLKDCDGTNKTLQEKIIDDWRAIKVGLFRGDTPGMGLDGPDGKPPICEDPDFIGDNPTRIPNTHEVAAALKINNAVNEKILRDTKGNKNHQNLAAFNNAARAKHSGFTLKATAGNLQDSIRVSGSNLNKSGIPGQAKTATFIKPEFEKPVLLIANQMLQNVKAMDKWIKSATSLGFLETRVADTICCFIRLLFSYAVYLVNKPEQNLGKFGQDIKQNKEFASFLKEMADREVGTTIADEFKKTRDELKNNPNSNKAINEITKIIKIIEALLSGLASSFSADLSLLINVDVKTLNDSIIGIIGKNLTVVIDTIMSEIRTPTNQFITNIIKNPDASKALDDCEVFKLTMGFMTCGVDAMHKSMLKMVSGLQRDINENWATIGGSIEAQYSVKVVNILREVINILLNDFYALFTVCNIDRVYTEDELRKSANNINKALGVDRQLDSSDNMDEIYKSKIIDIYSQNDDGQLEEIKLGENGEFNENNIPDSVFSSGVFDFLNPLEDINEPLLTKDIRTAKEIKDKNSNYDGINENQENIKLSKQQAIEIKLDNIADSAVLKCNSASTVLVDPEILGIKIFENPVRYNNQEDQQDI